MKPDEPKLKEYNVIRTETKSRVYKIKAKDKDEARRLVQDEFEGEIQPELDKVIEILYQVENI